MGRAFFINRACWFLNVIMGLQAFKLGLIRVLATFVLVIITLFGSVIVFIVLLNQIRFRYFV